MLATKRHKLWELIQDANVEGLHARPQYEAVALNMIATSRTAYFAPPPLILSRGSAGIALIATFMPSKATRRRSSLDERTAAFR